MTVSPARGKSAQANVRSCMMLPTTTTWGESDMKSGETMAGRGERSGWTARRGKNAEGCANVCAVAAANAIFFASETGSAGFPDDQLGHELEARGRPLAVLDALQQQFRGILAHF